MDIGASYKRGRPDTGSNGNAGFKKMKNETESISTGIGSKSKPCTKFFSTSGCPFGESCHFLHYVPGGFNAVAQMTKLGGNPSFPPMSRTPAIAPPMPSGLSPPVKSRMCNKFNTADGCKFGDKCRFAHGERELSKPIAPPQEDPWAMAPMAGRFPGRTEPPPPGLAAAASFGASATAKISVDASLAGAIIGKGGVNSKQICRLTGAKLAIRDHESDTNLRNIELEGTFDQIKQASAMVRELIVNVSSAAAAAMNRPPAVQANNFKTRLCENFSKGSCSFADQCHFAHGASELRKPGA